MTEDEKAKRLQAFLLSKPGKLAEFVGMQVNEDEFEFKFDDNKIETNIKPFKQSLLETLSTKFGYFEAMERSIKASELIEKYIKDEDCLLEVCKEVLNINEVVINKKEYSFKSPFDTLEFARINGQVPSFGM